MECKYCVSACCAAEPVAELIDTLWNVNKGVYVFDFSDNGGINRYIMECK